MFQWVRRLLTKPKDPWWVSLNRGVITVRDPSGCKKSGKLGDITAVVVETNDRGPLEDDVWWILYENDKEPLRFPQGIVGDDAVIDALIEFEGFNHSEMTSAMGCSENRRFTLWEKNETVNLIRFKGNVGERNFVIPCCIE